jgi:twitching motility protein PilT
VTDTALSDVLTPEVRMPPIAELLALVIDRGGSDMHLMAGSPPFIRLHGELLRLEEYPSLTPEGLRGMIYGILPQKLQQRFEQELELDTAYSLPGRARFRVNVYQQRDSVGAAFRLIPSRIATVDELDLPSVVADLARKPRGLVLITGPTGSGKSTTLASMVDVVNTERPAHVMTVEDPIEFLHTNKRSAVNQREVGHDTLGFAQALRHALRQDPDVILVGEMRDLETISTALSAGETGHLVFATLHTQDAAQAIDRIIDVFPAEQQQQVRVQLSTTLQGIVNQQLVPTTNGNGRVVATEVLVATPAVRALIRANKVPMIVSAMQTGAIEGMQTMDASLAQLVRTGRITREAALDRCHDEAELLRLT